MRIEEKTVANNTSVKRAISELQYVVSLYWHLISFICDSSAGLLITVVPSPTRVVSAWRLLYSRVQHELPIIMAIYCRVAIRHELPLWRNYSTMRCCGVGKPRC
jgi:hypothetical protein